MKAILHGMEALQNVTVTKIPVEKVNYHGLLNTLESNIDKALPQEFTSSFKIIPSIYKSMFTNGELTAEQLELNENFLEMAYESIGEDIEDLMNKPKSSNGRDYYYEWGRSFGVVKQASLLKEHLNDECDFI